ncbi:alkaline phosphatase D family protein [Rapidithrix thailandica]|uniref:Alkaline phosphatase D family protein n=1 Tax=Rapidithrix thailandica TaxID=413964 RepID=A0AAW9S4M9_9BACT
MKKQWIGLLACLYACLAWQCTSKKKEETQTTKEESVTPSYTKEHVVPEKVSKIAFGSCGYQDEPQPILQLAAEQNPDVFVFLGDNIYGDTKNMDTLRNKYKRLGAKEEFKNLSQSAHILATWDDHDYGWNDAGRHYPFKKESKEIFLDFWKAPADDIRHQREGIYTSTYFEAEGKTVQFILLDLRTFRDDLRKYEGQEVDTTKFHYGLDYWPYETADSTLMGTGQWLWLEEQLSIPADLRIVCSSSQFGITYNGYEAWANFPHEQQKLLDLIQKTQANGVMFISGDVHYAELSKLEREDNYPIYDLTSSGITSKWDFATPNDNRIAGAIMENHYGLIEIDWNPEDPVIHLKIVDINKEVRIHEQIKLSEIHYDKL